MPENIKGQISIMLNREIIESVRFFQTASPDFITQISCLLYPQICLNSDYIVKMGDSAHQMFFIHSGYVEVLCKNGTDSLVYLGKGDYFGEIGVLITGVRSVSVRAKSNSVIYFIKKRDLLCLLKEFPDQNDFLKGVGGQRLASTPFNKSAMDDSSEVAS